MCKVLLFCLAFLNVAVYYFFMATIFPNWSSQAHSSSLQQISLHGISLLGYKYRVQGEESQMRDAQKLDN
jgi:hypothetical protein